jgi:hypothetical protein
LDADDSRGQVAKGGARERQPDRTATFAGPLLVRDILIGKHNFWNHYPKGRRRPCARADKIRGKFARWMLMIPASPCYR